MELGQRKALTVAAVSAGVIAVSVITATIWGELPEAAWVVFSLGLWGGLVTLLVSLGMFVARRLRPDPSG